MADTFLTLKSPDGKTELELCPSVGGGITKFIRQHQGAVVELMRSFDRSADMSPLNFASFPLTPFSNRIGYGKLDFEGDVFSVRTPFLSGEHPNHGDGWMSPWRVIEQTGQSAVLAVEKNEDPYSYISTQVFTLTDDALTIDIMITNSSARRLPFGTGHHAYFPRNEQTVLKAHAPKVWTSINMLPDMLIDVPQKMDFSKGLALSHENLSPTGAGDDGSAYIDHCFQDWDQYAEIIWPEKGMKLIMTADSVFKNFVVYIPAGKNFFCAEPVTNATDGFNLLSKGVKNTGTVILEPGETLRGTVRFKPELL